MTRPKPGFDGGFTFVETLIVLAITVILTAGIGIPALQHIERAKRAAARGEIETLRVCLQSYYLDCGSYPEEAQGLSALFEKPSIHPVPDEWNGPYTDRPPANDPWGNEYIYSRTDTGGPPFVIVSFGADGSEGGEGNDADIRSDRR